MPIAPSPARGLSRLQRRILAHLRRAQSRRQGVDHPPAVRWQPSRWNPGLSQSRRAALCKALVRLVARGHVEGVRPKTKTTHVRLTPAGEVAAGTASALAND